MSMPSSVNWIARRLMNGAMGALVGSGVGIDERGRLCLPDGLTPERMHRFIELCMQERHACPRDALHALFLRLGVGRSTVSLLNHVLDEGGDVELGVVAARSASLAKALPELHRIPERFRRFLVHDLALADPACTSLDEAVVSARKAAAARVPCAPTWDAILEHAEAVSDLARPWREGIAAA